jgi:hypothetical protein
VATPLHTSTRYVCDPDWIQLQANFSARLSCHDDCINGSWTFHWDPHQSDVSRLSPRFVKFYVYNWATGAPIYGRNEVIDPNTGEVGFQFKYTEKFLETLRGEVALYGTLYYCLHPAVKAVYVPTSIFLDFTETRAHRFYQYTAPPLASAGLASVATYKVDDEWIYNQFNWYLVEHKDSLTQRWTALNLTLVGPVEFHLRDDLPESEILPIDEPGVLKAKCYLNSVDVIAQFGQNNRSLTFGFTSKDNSYDDVMRNIFFENSFVQFDCLGIAIVAKRTSSDLHQRSYIKIEYITRQSEEDVLDDRPQPFLLEFNPYLTYHADIKPQLPLNQRPSVIREWIDFWEPQDKALATLEAPENNPPNDFLSPLADPDHDDNDNHEYEKDSTDPNVFLYPQNLSPSMLSASTFSSDGLVTCTWTFLYKDLKQVLDRPHRSHVEYTGVNHIDPDFYPSYEAKNTVLHIHTRLHEAQVEPQKSKDGGVEKIKGFTKLPSSTLKVPIYSMWSGFINSVYAATATSFEFPFDLTLFKKTHVNPDEPPTNIVDVIAMIPVSPVSITGQPIQCTFVIHKEMCPVSPAAKQETCKNKYNNAYITPIFAKDPPVSAEVSKGVQGDSGVRRVDENDQNNKYDHRLSNAPIYSTNGVTASEVRKEIHTDDDGNSTIRHIAVEKKDNKIHKKLKQKSMQVENDDSNPSPQNKPYANLDNFGSKKSSPYHTRVINHPILHPVPNKSNDKKNQIYTQNDPKNTKKNTFSALPPTQLSPLSTSDPTQDSPVNTFIFTQNQNNYNATSIVILPFETNELMSTFKIHLNYTNAVPSAQDYFDRVLFQFPMRYWEFFKIPSQTGDETEPICEFRHSSKENPIIDPSKLHVDVAAPRIHISGFGQVRLKWPLSINCTRIGFARVWTHLDHCNVGKGDCWSPWSSKFSIRAGPDNWLSSEKTHFDPPTSNSDEYMFQVTNQVDSSIDQFDVKNVKNVKNNQNNKNGQYQSLAYNDNELNSYFDATRSYSSRLSTSNLNHKNNSQTSKSTQNSFKNHNSLLTSLSHIINEISIHLLEIVLEWTHYGVYYIQNGHINSIDTLDFPWRHHLLRKQNDPNILEAIEMLFTPFEDLLIDEIRQSEQQQLQNNQRIESDHLTPQPPQNDPYQIPIKSVDYNNLSYEQVESLQMNSDNNKNLEKKELNQNEILNFTEPSIQSTSSTHMIEYFNAMKGQYITNLPHHIAQIDKFNKNCINQQDDQYLSSYNSQPRKILPLQSTSPLLPPEMSIFNPQSSDNYRGWFNLTNYFSQQQYFQHQAIITAEFKPLEAAYSARTIKLAGSFFKLKGANVPVEISSVVIYLTVSIFAGIFLLVLVLVLHKYDVFTRLAEKAAKLTENKKKGWLTEEEIDEKYTTEFPIGYVCEELY